MSKILKKRRNKKRTGYASALIKRYVIIFMSDLMFVNNKIRQENIHKVGHENNNAPLN